MSVGRFDYHKIPRRTREELREWVLKGRHPGYFLTAVLRNDLARAVASADEENAEALVPLCMFLYNRMPSPAQGSPEAMEEWPKKLADVSLGVRGAFVVTFGPFDQDAPSEFFTIGQE